MKYLFEQLPNIRLDKPNALDHLLPWAEDISAACRLDKKSYLTPPKNDFGFPIHKNRKANKSNNLFIY